MHKLCDFARHLYRASHLLLGRLFYKANSLSRAREVNRLIQRRHTQLDCPTRILEWHLTCHEELLQRPAISSLLFPLKKEADFTPERNPTQKDQELEKNQSTVALHPQPCMPIKTLIARGIEATNLRVPKGVRHFSILICDCRSLLSRVSRKVIPVKTGIYNSKSCASRSLPAKAGIYYKKQIPAFAGMTMDYSAGSLGADLWARG